MPVDLLVFSLFCFFRNPLHNRDLIYESCYRGDPGAIGILPTA